MNTNPLFTNVVLVIIAALLLVLVIQNGMKPSPMARPMMAPSHSTAMGGEERNPTVNNNAAQMGGNMFFMAMTAFPEGCKGAKILNECDSPAAKSVKSKIEALVAQGQGPRQVFDYVVQTWGEDALTEQARQIRNMRVKGK